MEKQDYVSNIFFFFLHISIIIFILYIILSFNEYNKQITRSKELSLLSVAVKERSEKDREHIASLLHDTVIQNLGSLLISLQFNSTSMTDVSENIS